MYTISQYGQMIACKARTTAYANALRRAVRPDSVLLDLGAGTGIFALLACRFGAQRVYAIEPDVAINIAKESSTANGFSDRLICIQNLSTKIALPERVDIIVSDLAGSLPLFQRGIPAIVDARRRFLKPGGTLIPRRDQLRGAIVEAPDEYRKLSHPWSERLFDLDLSAGWRFVGNTAGHFAAKSAWLLTGPSDIAALDYETIERSNIAVHAVWTVERSGTGHGISIWFERTLADGIEMSNAPNASEAIGTADVYGQQFFPWVTPIDVQTGDRIVVDLKADLVADEYVWQWETTIRGSGDQQEIKAHFRQSTLLGYPLAVLSLQKDEANYIPAADEDVSIDRLILTKIDGRTSIGQIARGISEKFPMRFQSWQEAVSRVKSVTGQSNGR